MNDKITLNFEIDKYTFANFSGSLAEWVAAILDSMSESQKIDIINRMHQEEDEDIGYCSDIRYAEFNRIVKE